MKGKTIGFLESNPKNGRSKKELEELEAKAQKQLKNAAFMFNREIEKSKTNFETVKRDASGAE